MNDVFDKICNVYFCSFVIIIYMNTVKSLQKDLPVLLFSETLWNMKVNKLSALRIGCRLTTRFKYRVTHIESYNVSSRTHHSFIPLTYVHNTLSTQKCEQIKAPAGYRLSSTMYNLSCILFFFATYMSGCAMLW